MKLTASGICTKFLVIGAMGFTLLGCPSGDEDSCPIVIDGFTPASGKVGDVITIVGSHLGGTAAKVGWKGVESDAQAGSDEMKLMVRVPNGASTAQITVDVPSVQNCQSLSEGTFTVIP
jgi:hypothetical protein